MQYFNKPPSVGQPTPPHQDGYYFMLDPCEAVTMWFALDEVDEENGRMRYVPVFVTQASSVRCFSESWESVRVSSEKRMQ
jgi:ectoine hydroxylase-related dioxygenase (phytanoyl-CoA dioxygenase family)